MAVELLGRLTEPAERCPHIPAGSMAGVLVPAPYPNPLRRLWAIATGQPQQILLCARCLPCLRELSERKRLRTDPPSRQEVFSRMAALDWPADDRRRFWRSLQRQVR